MSDASVESESFGIGHNKPPQPLSAAEVASYLLDTQEDLLVRRNALKEAVVRFKAKHPTIEDDETQRAAGDFKKQIQACIGIAKERFTREKDPFLNGGRAVDAFFTAIRVPLEAALAEINRPMTAYAVKIAAEEKARREEVARAAREASEAAQRAMAKPEAAVTIEDAIGTAQHAERAEKAAAAPAADMSRRRGELGSVNSLREVWDVEVEDISKVPPEYMLFDHDKARAAVRRKDGLRAIPGCRVFSTQHVVTR
jgi:hypothetical protein